MIKLEISVRPKSIKYLEFSQSLDSIRDALEQRCTTLLITEKEKYFSIIAGLNSAEQLTKVLQSVELRVLSGAIRVLCEESKIKIHSGTIIRKGSDLRKVGLDFLKFEIKKYEKQ